MSAVAPLASASAPVADWPPSIVCDSEVATAREKIIAALGRHLNVFRRGGRLVSVVRPSRHDDVDCHVDEAPEIRRLVRATLLDAASEVAQFIRIKRTKSGEEITVKTLPSADIVNAVLEAGEYPEIPQLVGVSETPIVCPDGQISTEEGYDLDTGIFFAPNAKYLDVNAHPSEADARSAYARLVEPFREFPFDPPELGRAVVVAAILTVLARNAIHGPVPLFLVRKNVRGCGGTLLSDAVAIITTGRNAGRMTMPDEPEELEKVLSAFALRGSQLICFDNVSRLGGGPLDKCITAQDAVDLRVLGQSRIERLPWRAVVFANGNNVEIAGDTTRRVLCATLTSELEQPEKRTGFAHHPLRAYLTKNRVQFVRDALTVLSAWYATGCPDVGAGQLGSFEDWSRIVGNAIVLAGGVSPLGAYAEAVGVVDAERHALETLVAEWRRLAPAGGLTAKTAIELLYPTERLRGNAPPDGFDDLREAIEAMVPTAQGKAPSAHKLGYTLRKFRRRVVGGAMLDCALDRKGVAKWSVIASKVPGMPGIAGDVYSLRASEVREKNNGNGGEHPRPSPASPAGSFADDLADLGIGGGL